MVTNTAVSQDAFSKAGHTSHFLTHPRDRTHHILWVVFALANACPFRAHIMQVLTQSGVSHDAGIIRVLSHAFLELGSCEIGVAAVRMSRKEGVPP